MADYALHMRIVGFLHGYIRKCTSACMRANWL